MTKKWHVLKKVIDTGLVVIIRTEKINEIKKIAEACITGGAKAIELSYTMQNTSLLIEELVSHFKSEDVSIGAGTVLDSETARIAILSGAQYIVSPYINEQTIKLCNRYQVPCIPGAMTIEEVLKGMEFGGDIIKVFPSEVLGINMIKAIKAPIPQANLMPTGGVTPENVYDWIKAGAIAVGIGGSINKKAENNDFTGITKIVGEYLKRIKEAKSNSV
jgi:2-dehydro-3-deoxyphosphogluconate aldolase / (4S)-4-hydroxy-2-oxoglutarate aldolase